MGARGAKYPINDGSDWSLGTPSKLGQLPHDGAMGLDGNLYYTVNNPNPDVTVGKVDAKTGEVKYLKVDRKDGKFAATAHGLTRDGNGDLWFDVNPGRRSLGKLDVKTEKISVYETPEPMSPLGGAVTLDVDGKGKHLGFGAGWRRRLRSRGREVHRLQVDDAVQERQGHQHDLRRRGRPRRQRLVGADGVRHHRQGRHGDRQDHRDHAAVAQGRDGTPARGKARLL